MISKAEILNVLQTGEIDVEGLMPWSSNYTFLIRVCTPQFEIPAVYKPRRGERPLWGQVKWVEPVVFGLILKVIRP